MTETYTEPTLEKMSLIELWGIVQQLALDRGVDPDDICPSRRSHDLLVSSIIEAQEEAFGS